mgnify:CR=1 FL=1
MRTSRSTVVCRVVMALVPCLGGGALLAGPTAQAAITDASGRVEASVRQTNATTGQIIDEAFEETPGTTNILPAEADASLEVTTPSSPEQGRLSSVAAVNVPGENAAADTNDFALEAAGLVLPAGRGFASDARATQTRQITLSRSELNINSGRRVRVRSTFVISSGVFLVTLPGSTGDVAGRIRFSVRQQDDEGSREVLAGGLDVSFDEGTLRTVPTGALAGAKIVPVDLSTESTQVEQAQLVLLPFLSIPYEYEAVVGWPFSLVAEVTASTGSDDGAQGGSAFVGRLPNSFTAALDEFLGTSYGEDVDTLAESFEQEPAGLPGGTTVEPIMDNVLGACGEFGMESLLAAMTLSMVFARRSL